MFFVTDHSIGIHWGSEKCPSYSRRIWNWCR